MDEQPVATSDAAAAASNASTCVIDERWVGPVVVVSASGVIDMLTAPQLEQAVRSAFDNQKPAGIVVDFTDVEFLASAGMGILVALHDEVSPEVRFCVVADGPATSRPLQLVGIADLIKIHATVDEALSALSA